MNAKDIRELEIGPEELYTNELLREIAAQLAEVNSNLRRIAERSEG